jgi:hypothetical protein
MSQTGLDITRIIRKKNKAENINPNSTGAWSNVEPAGVRSVFTLTAAQKRDAPCGELIPANIMLDYPLLFLHLPRV